jgi:hypothetical protein
MTDFEKEVARLLNGILVEDLTPVENKIVKMLVKQGVLKIEDNDGDPIVTLLVN